MDTLLTVSHYHQIKTMEILLTVIANNNKSIVNYVNLIQCLPQAINQCYTREKFELFELVDKSIGQPWKQHE